MAQISKIINMLVTVICAKKLLRFNTFSLKWNQKSNSNFICLIIFKRKFWLLSFCILFKLVNSELLVLKSFLWFWVCLLAVVAISWRSLDNYLAIWICCGFLYLPDKSVFGKNRSVHAPDALKAVIPWVACWKKCCNIPPFWIFQVYSTLVTDCSYSASSVCQSSWCIVL